MEIMADTQEVASSARFDNAADLAAYLTGSKDIRERVKREISNQHFVSFLTKLRHLIGMNQEEIAHAMACNQSKISRLETGDDKQVSIFDAQVYLHALGFSMKVYAEPLDEEEIPDATRIKNYVFAIKEKLDSLTALAKKLGGDDELTEKISEFRSEVLLNFLYMFEESRQHVSAFDSVTLVEQVVSPVQIQDEMLESSKC